jgi:very-short-patch-repair endonuclease
MSSMAQSPAHSVELRSATSRLVVEANELLGADGAIISELNRFKSAFTRLTNRLDRFKSLSTSAVEVNTDLSSLHDTAKAICNLETQLKSWCDWCRVRHEAQESGLKPLADAVAESALPIGGALEAFETAYARWFASQVIDAELLLRNFVSAEHMSDIDAYCQAEDHLSKLSVRYARAKLCGVIPSKNDTGKQGGFSILKHELQKSRRHKPVRQLALEMGDAMQKLAPCMLMSPLSIAQYLPADLAPFDLVIFDEASQIAPWDAIGSIARGKQVVIAGDPRQMPPTNFFNRGASASEDDTEDDMESILDECLGAGIPSHSLSWHYRSRHESLIAFSNHRYYDNNLITFPAPETRASAVEWRYVNGVYSRGKGRNNQAEAEAMVAETVHRLTDPQFVAQGFSIGIITLNSDQQTLVTNLLDLARQKHPEIEPFFQDGLAEPVVVKNLETVQGDERDLIMFGIGYGPTEPGSKAMSMNFGPLNKEGGWRRLNVAVTRARREMLVFTSFDSAMVDLNRTNARAVRDLKHFIEFANRGPRALAEAVQGSVGTYDSPFEEAVAEGLRRRGWEVVPQIGVSRFRIDLGIVHPDYPGDYLLGVECDGATYHSAATARDRDKVRSAILQGLGWKLLRVWSTDWWIDKEGALERLHAAIEAVLQISRTTASATITQTKPVIMQLQPDQPSVEADTLVETSTVTTINNTVSSLQQPELPLSRLHRSKIPVSAKLYRVTDFADINHQINSALFYSDEYDPILGTLIDRVLEHEAPILDSLLVQRIARAHGFSRSGRLIRERVLEFVEKKYHLQLDATEALFVWQNEQHCQNWTHYRIPENDSDVRSIEEIAIEEIRAAASAVLAEDQVLEVARLFNVKRLSSTARRKIEEAIKA